VNDEIINRKIKEYVEKYGHLYDEFEKLYLERLNIEMARNYRREIPDITRQVLEELGYYNNNPEQSSYEYFINLIDKEFGLEKNIVEVAGGVVPTLGHKISLKQQKGTITIYDPRMSNYYDETERFILKKERFRRSTNLEDTDLLIGFMPCEATQEIIENATDNSIDFIIALCEGGPHGDEFDYFDSTEEWLHAMLYLAKRGIEDQNMGELKVLSFKKYTSQYPIIYNKRKQ